MDDPNYPIRYDVHHSSYYRLCYDHATQSWAFLDWLNWPPPAPGAQPARPVVPIPRRDSHSARTYPSSAFTPTYPTYGSAQHQTNVGAAYPHGYRYTQPTRGRQGNLVEGTYNANHPALNSEHEALDPLYRVRDRVYFREGRMFSILFTEPAGENAVKSMINKITDYNSAISRVIYNQYVHTQVRRFIVVRQKKAHCYAVPIFTYSGQGTLKFGVVPDEHAVAYSYGQEPELLPREQELSKGGICIVMNRGEKDLSIASRIYFGIHHPIQYNVKVKDLGYVHPDFMPAFKGYWNLENAADTLQAHEVTREAEQAIEDESEPESRYTIHAIGNHDNQVHQDDGDDDDDNEHNENHDRNHDEDDNSVQDLTSRLRYTNLYGG